MKHARPSRPRDVAMDVLYAMGARRSDVGGRHRAALAGDEFTPSSKLSEAVAAEPMTQAAS